jgi:hypothetical protein
MARVERTIDRYRRDVGLLTGQIVPISVDLDDLALLDFVGLSVAPEKLINDRKLRIKTLEATLDMLREATRPATGRTD